MSTRFAVVGLFQYMENYADDPETQDYWKAKGGSEKVLRDDLTIADACTINKQEVLAGFNAMEENNRYCQFYLIDWNLVELSERTISEVREYLEKSDPTEDFGYLRYCFEGGEYAFDWATEALKKRGELSLSGPRYGYQKFALNPASGA